MRGVEKDNYLIRDSFKKMTFREKVDYIITYYKFPIITALIAAAVLISTVVNRLNRKEPVLYTAFANVVIGETLHEQLTDEYLRYAGKTAKQGITVYEGLYISDDPATVDHQIAYASKLKLLGAVNTRQLDVVLMNKEAYDLFSSSGFLCNLDELMKTDPKLYQQLSDLIQINTVILDDNAVEFSLGEADEYISETEDIKNGLDVSSAALLKDAGFPDTVYLGIIENSIHKEEAVNYIRYLFQFE